MNTPASAASLEAKFREALAVHQKGGLAQAQQLYQDVLAIEPRHSQSLHLLGVIAQQTGQYQRAVDLIDAAIGVEPGNAVFYYNRGNALCELQQLQAAVASYRKALELRPAFAESCYSMGNAFMALHELDSALACYDRAIAIHPGMPLFHFARGNALVALQKYDAAIESYDRVIARIPDFAEAHSNRGKALLELRRLEAAAASYDQAIQLKPELVDAYTGRGLTRQALKQPDAALADFQKAVALVPNLAEAHHNLASAFQELGQLDAASASYRKSIELAPESAETYSNLGNVLQKLGKLDAAVAMYSKAIDLKPAFADAYYNRGIAFKELNRLEAAVADYTRAIRLKPDYDFLLGILLHTRMRICDWDGIGAQFELLAARLKQMKKAAPPFPVLNMLDAPALQKAAAEVSTQTWNPASNALGAIPRRSRRPKIRVGYYSADFRNHAMTYLMAGLYESHDRANFELIGFSFGPERDDEMRSRVAASFDQFIDVRPMSDREVAALSRQLEIDIAVDLNGFTDHSRCGIFAERSAPIQVNYLGYPGTMGADYFDYVIADDTLVPTSDQVHFTEKIVYLPGSYQVNDRTRQIASTGYTREAAGLPAEAFVFCCFNRNCKITPEVFDIWMRLLRSVDGSVLWLFEDSRVASHNLRKEAGERGIDANRLIFAGQMPLAEHLERHRLADLYLDTLPYNGHTSTSDALWAGLPVLTLMGKSFASRVAASLLKAMGLPELVTQSASEYESLAVALATDPGKLAGIRRQLAANRLTTPLFDTPLYTKHLEAAYRRMWDRYLADLPPDHIRIEP